MEQKLTRVQEVSKVYNKRLQELMGRVLIIENREPSVRRRNEANGREEK